jgi:hypothetical protein
MYIIWPDMQHYDRKGRLCRERSGADDVGFDRHCGSSSPDCCESGKGRINVNPARACGQVVMQLCRLNQKQGHKVLDRRQSVPVHPGANAHCMWLMYNYLKSSINLAGLPLYQTTYSSRSSSTTLTTSSLSSLVLCLAKRVSPLVHLTSDNFQKSRSDGNRRTDQCCNSAENRCVRKSIIPSSHQS